MTIAPLEEMRRRRAATVPYQKAPALPHVTVSTASPEPARRKNFLPWVLSIVFFVAACSLGAGWLLSGPIISPAAKPVVEGEGAALHPLVTEQQHLTINQALADLRAGMATHALISLRNLRSDNPSIPSIDYMVALAALQAGEQEEASLSIDASIGKGEKVSDALALRAALEAQTENHVALKSVDGIEPVADRLLRQAMQADPANPFPYIELATRLRERGQDAEARAYLESARTRLQPVDPHIIAEVSLRLMDLAGQPDEALPTLPSEATSISDLFGAAYLAYRLGQPDRGAAFLDEAKAALSPELYAYLLSDPVLRKVIPSPS
jgi:Tfp pilus assembly protein PilF